ncbi:MAG: dioxygenase [Thermoguttaceae bacterium]|jgi:enamine deaminase RidA (YjgF/YER057c/UK114 family)
MADHTIRKLSHSGVGYSVVDLNDVRHVFAAATPGIGSTFDQQADDALRTIRSVTGEEGTRGSIVHQAVFLADMTYLGRCQQIMRDFYGPELPTTSYIPQPPCGGKLLAIEALGVGQGLGEVQIQRVSEELVIARHNGIAWVHCTKTVPQGRNRPVYDGSRDVLEAVCRTLGSVKVRFDQVIRTWFYLGGIVENDGPLQRYKELNRARSDFFQDIHFLNGRAPAGHSGRVYPSSTGIGTSGRGIILSAIALVSDRSDIQAVPLENPRQTAAYDYATSYSPHSPKFSRAMVLSCGTYTTIFISGTASITHSQTRHPGDPVKQTEETLDNIAALIAEENLARHRLPGLGTTLASLGFARVYIKRPDDYTAVRATCEKRLGMLPTIYAIADICRPELLVEIEGVAFSRLEQ